MAEPTTSPSLSDVDPLFGGTKKPSEGPDLGSIDPIFATPAGNVGTTSASNVKRPGSDFVLDDDNTAPGKSRITPEEGAALGAAARFATGFIPMSESRAPSVVGTKAALAAAKSNVEQLTKDLGIHSTKHAGHVDALTKQLTAAQANYNQAQAALEVARQQAAKLNIPLEVPTIEPGELSAGDKWSTKVVGSMGPGGEGVTEAARNYRMQQSLTPSEAAQFKASRSGLIVPNKLEQTGPYYNPAQQTVANNLTQAQADFAAAQKELNGLQSQLDKTKTPPKIGRIHDQLDVARRKVESTAAKLEALQGSKPDMLSRIGMAINRVPFSNILGGGLAGYDAVKAYEDYQAGRPVDMVMHGLGAAGGALGMAPNPWAKGAGFLMQVPPLAYEVYKQYQDVSNPSRGPAQ